MGDVLVFPAGSAIMFTSGEYSDFGLCGCVVTLKECDMKSLMREFMLTGNKGDWQETPDPDDFPSWLVSQGHAFPADIQKVHVGDYSRPCTSLVTRQEYLDICAARENEATQ